MTQEEVDRVLAEQLTVEPSPDFVARVRAQVAAEPMPAGWNRWWPAAGAAVAAVALFVGGGLQTNDGVGPPAVGGGAVAIVERPATNSASTRVSTSVEVPGDTRRSRIAHTRAVASFPRVLIAPEDAWSVELLLASTNQGVGPPAHDESPSVPLTVTRIELALLDLEPLAALTQIHQGEVQ